MGGLNGWTDGTVGLGWVGLGGWRGEGEIVLVGQWKREGAAFEGSNEEDCWVR